MFVGAYAFDNFLFKYPQINLQGNQHLSKLIMNFPGQQYPFFFADILQVGCKTLQLFLRILQCYFHPLAFGNIPNHSHNFSTIKRQNNTFKGIYLVLNDHLVFNRLGWLIIHHLYQSIFQYFKLRIGENIKYTLTDKLLFRHGQIVHVAGFEIQKNTFGV
jgi:hypothetical protein